MPTNTKPILFFSCGNPSRGDDAIGPEFLQRLEFSLKHLPETSQVEFLFEYQFQVEHAIDLLGRKCVVFVDANTSIKAPFELKQIFGEKDASYTTHSMNPESVLYIYQKLYKKRPPTSYTLSIRGESFELGDSLSISAEHNIEQALVFIQNNFKRFA